MQPADWLLVGRFGFLFALYGLLVMVLRSTWLETRDVQPRWDERAPGDLLVIDGGLGLHRGGRERIPLLCESTLGRGPYSMARFEDRSVSDLHATLIWGPFGWSLRNESATNPTRINDVPLIGVAPVDYGADISLGDVKLRLVRRRRWWSSL